MIIYGAIKMKILYVEDELTKNVPRIKKLFRKFISEKDIKKLEELENDESGFGISVEEIKGIVEKSGIIDVAYSFPMALEKVFNSFDEYSMFIVDRNLLEQPYKISEVKEIDSNYSVENEKMFSEREGDYLLRILVMKKKIDVRKKFYFLSAFSDSSIQGADDLKLYIDTGDFSKKNFIGKSEDTKLKELINKHELLNIQSENKEFIDIIREPIGNKAVKRFCEAIERKDNDSMIIGNLAKLRNLTEKLLKKVALNSEVKNECINEYDKFDFGPFRRWLNDELEKNPNGGLKKKIYTNSKNKNKRFNYSKTINQALYSIQGISSEDGVHEKYKEYGFEPTINTVNTIIYSLKDVILWYGTLLK